DQLLQLRAIGAGVVGGGGVAGEQLRGDLVDPLVGALRGENRGDRELQRPVVIQFTPRIRVGLGEHPRHPPSAPLPPKRSFDPICGKGHVGQPTSQKTEASAARPPLSHGAKPRLAGGHRRSPGRYRAGEIVPSSANRGAEVGKSASDSSRSNFSARPSWSMVGRPRSSMYVETN